MLMSLPEIAVMCYFQNIFTVGSDASFLKCFPCTIYHTITYAFPVLNLKGISKVSIAAANGAQAWKTTHHTCRSSA